MDPLIGQIELFPYQFIPVGWMFCEGQMLLINEYMTLYSLIGVQFGGDGRTNFALPDLRGKEPVANTRYCIAVTGAYPSRN